MPKNEIVPASFDYKVCTTDEKSKLIWCAAEVGRLKSHAAETVIELGKTLAIAQEQLSSHHGGTFIRWVESECGLSKDTAYRSISSFRTFESCRSVRQLEVTAMYALSQNETPKSAVKEAIKRADNGEKITANLARQIIKKHADKPEDGAGLEPSGEPETTEPGAQEPPEPASNDSEGEPDGDQFPTSFPVVDEPAEPDPDSLESVQADLRDLEKQIRDVCRAARKVLAAEGNEITRPWCGCYSLLSLVHPLQSVARTILNDLPVGGTPKNPILAREQVAEAAG